MVKYTFFFCHQQKLGAPPSTASHHLIPRCANITSQFPRAVKYRSDLIMLCTLYIFEMLHICI